MSKKLKIVAQPVKASEASSIDELLFGDNPNRIIKSVQRVKEQIAERIKQRLTTQEEVSKTHKNLDLPMDEFCAFQEIKSLAMQHNKISLEEAQTVYAYLGNEPSHFNRQPIEVKVVLTQLLGELLKWRLGGMAVLALALLFFGGNIAGQEKGTRAAAEQYRQSHMDVYGRPPMVNGGVPDKPLTVYVVKNVNAGTTPYRLYVIEPVKVGAGAKKSGAIWHRLETATKAREYAKEHGYTRIVWRQTK